MTDGQSEIHQEDFDVLNNLPHFLYLAGPYTHADPRVMAWRARQHAKAAWVLMQRGHVVFSPIAHSHAISEAGGHAKQTDGDFWWEQDKPFLEFIHRRNGAFVQLGFPELVESAGTKREYKYMCCNGSQDTMMAYVIRPSLLGLSSSPSEAELAAFGSPTVVAASPPTMATPPRASILHEAESLICGDRNTSYGPPTKDFERIAAMWSTLFGRTFQPHEVAMAMECLKLSRLVHSPTKRDNWTDMAGYAACGWECAQLPKGDAA